MRLLLHICCGVCGGAPIEELRRREIDVEGYFFNPNIHPFAEFVRRVEALRNLPTARGIKLEYDERYGLEEFLAHVLPNDAGRCLRCYRLRLRQTARRAREFGFDAFATTLLISRHQNHNLIRQAGEEASREFGVSFLSEDWRPLGRRSLELAKDANIYRQRYCGCIFSEYEAARQQMSKKATLR